MTKEKRKERDELLQKVMLSMAKDIKLPQVDDFLHILKDNQFFDDFSMGDLLTMYSDKEYWIGFCRNKLYIQMEAGENYAKFGIDPKYCFDSLKRSSILVKFPMKKREYESFKKFFLQLIHEGSNIRKDWFKEAPECFYGQYAQFGL